MFAPTIIHTHLQVISRMISLAADVLCSDVELGALGNGGKIAGMKRVVLVQLKVGVCL